MLFRLVLWRTLDVGSDLIWLVLSGVVLDHVLNRLLSNFGPSATTDKVWTRIQTSQQCCSEGQNFAHHMQTQPKYPRNTQTHAQTGKDQQVRTSETDEGGLEATRHREGTGETHSTDVRSIREARRCDTNRNNRKWKQEIHHLQRPTETGQIYSQNTLSLPGWWF